MSKIKIKNFGPIRDGFVNNNGWMDIEKVTVFIGDQGSGKSTVAKLISVFFWVSSAISDDDAFLLLMTGFEEDCLLFISRVPYYILINKRGRCT